MTDAAGAQRDWRDELSDLIEQHERGYHADIIECVEAIVATREREARRQGMEEAAKIADVWEPDNSKKYPDYVAGWECEKTCEGIAESIRARAQAEEGEG